MFKRDVVALLPIRSESWMSSIATLHKLHPEECTPVASVILVDTQQRPSARQIHTKATDSLFSSLSTESVIGQRAPYSQRPLNVCHTAGGWSIGYRIWISSKKSSMYSLQSSSSATTLYLCRTLSSHPLTFREGLFRLEGLSHGRSTASLMMLSEDSSPLPSASTRFEVMESSPMKDCPSGSMTFCSCAQAGDGDSLPRLRPWPDGPDSRLTLAPVVGSPTTPSRDCCIMLICRSSWATRAASSWLLALHPCERRSERGTNITVGSLGRLFQRRDYLLRDRHAVYTECTIDRAGASGSRCLLGLDPGGGFAYSAPGSAVSTRVPALALRSVQLHIGAQAEGTSFVFPIEARTDFDLSLLTCRAEHQQALSVKW